MYVLFSCSFHQLTTSPYRTTIHILNDDVLLNIFYLYLPISLPVDGDTDYLLNVKEWHQHRWWYKLTHVCQRWRSLILASASYLRLSLFCTYRTPVAEMLAHSPPLPLIIDYFDNIQHLTPEDEEGILLALQHRDRVRSICLLMHAPCLQKFTTAMDDNFAILECLAIVPLIIQDTRLVLPKTFQAPHLCHLLLMNFAFPIGSSFFTAAPAVNLVSLSLSNILQSKNFHLNHLLQPLLHIPQLETLSIHFRFPFPNHYFERQLLHSPIMTHITLPNLRIFAFGGTCACLEALLPHMTTPLLETLQIQFFPQNPLSVPHLQQFLSAMENPKFSHATLSFDNGRVLMSVYPHAAARMNLLSMEVSSPHLDWQVPDAAQIFDTLKIVSSSVEYLILKYTHSYVVEPGYGGEADRSQWRELLRPFSNLTALHVPSELIQELSLSLTSVNGESPMELLPKLVELSYSGSYNGGDAFTRFIVSRHNAGHPVALVHHYNPLVLR